MKFLSPNSPIMRAVSRLVDLGLLNFFFLLTCIPIFTIGAGLTAMYTVVFRIGTEREEGIVVSYFRAFRANFKQSTILWLILLVCGLCSFWDITFFVQMTGPVHYLFIPFAIMFLLTLLISAYVFPLLSQFDNTNVKTLKNALILSIGYLPKSLLMAFMNVFPILVLFYSLLLFLEAGFLWVFLYFAAVAYLNASMLKKIFKPYQPEESEEEEK